MVATGRLDAEHLWGTIHMSALDSLGRIAAATTTSGLSWKIPGRVGDSPILGAGLYVDNAVGAAGSTGRGEANLYNLTSFLIVENLRRGLHPKDAALDGLARIRAATVEKRLLDAHGQPASTSGSTPSTAPAASPAPRCGPSSTARSPVRGLHGERRRAAGLRRSARRAGEELASLVSRQRRPV
jgi:N4-(beta-N-acetylglucosaminyl)-L-asparaginase